MSENKCCNNCKFLVVNCDIEIIDDTVKKSNVRYVCKQMFNLFAIYDTSKFACDKYKPKNQEKPEQFEKYVKSELTKIKNYLFQLVNCFLIYLKTKRLGETEKEFILGNLEFLRDKLCADCEGTGEQREYINGD